MTQNNLGAAFWTLGERQAAANKAKGCAALEAAREHYAAALEEFRKAGAAHYVGVVEGNIARLEADIARLCGMTQATAAAKPHGGYAWAAALGMSRHLPCLLSTTFL